MGLDEGSIHALARFGVVVELEPARAQEAREGAVARILPAGFDRRDRGLRHSRAAREPSLGEPSTAPCAPKQVRRLDHENSIAHVWKVRKVRKLGKATGRCYSSHYLRW